MRISPVDGVHEPHRRAMREVHRTEVACTPSR
jgi:hypothetical protein